MRKAKIVRKTKETNVEVELNLDGVGRARADTTIKFLDHLISSMAKHGGFDIRLKARGDLSHHIAEDSMIALGEALEKALGKKLGIERIGDITTPMDDALVLVAIDLSGRAYPDIEAEFKMKKIDDLNTDLIVHLLQTLAINGRFNLHVKVLRGKNDHHKAEAMFKGLGIALRKAVAKTAGRAGVPSTKGVV